MLVSRPVAVLGAVVLAAAALGSGPAAAAPADPTPQVPDRAVSPLRISGAVGRDDARALVSARSGRSTTTFAVRSTRASATPGVRAAAGSLGAELAPASSPLAALGWTSVTVPTSEADATRARLAALPGVAEVVVAQPRFPDYVPNDSLYASQQAPMMTALQEPTAWDIAQGSGITIAVLDGGFHVTHPDLASKIDTTWDVVAGNATVTDSPTDTVPGHGTAAASVAAAATNNGVGIAGAAPLARLMLVQVGDDANAGEITDLTSAAGIRWAVDHGADVISMSYGAVGTPSAPESDAVAYAIANDVVVVASAGNDGTSVAHYPAALAGVLAVGATTNTGTTQASWSTYGSWVDIAAPGEGVPVALPAVADDQDGMVDGYSVWQGTSFSGPLVAGIAAVLRSANPSATEAEVRAALTSTTKPITKTNSGYAHGLVQAATAARILVNPSITAPAEGAALSGTVTVSATSAASNVRFSVDGTTVATKIATSGGVASGQLGTYGLAGDVTLRAQSCTTLACGTGTTRTVSVTNPAPV
ncbi:S8 family serine peptidase, partial [Longivirga aurantiaca]